MTDGTMEQEGTFNANPLSAAAARVVLSEILTPDVYERYDEQERVLAGATARSSAGTTSRRRSPRSVAGVPCTSASSRSATSATTETDGPLLTSHGSTS